MRRTYTFLALLLFFISGGIIAQDLSDQALDNLQSSYAELGLSAADVTELQISDDYTSNGIRHIFVQQYYQGVPVFNGIAGLHYKADRLVYRTSRFATGFEEQQPSVTPAIDVVTALMNAASPLDITTSGAPRLTATEGNRRVFSWAEVSNEPITAELMMINKEGQLQLSWQFNIDQINTPDLWLIQIDAQSGATLARYNQTLYCSFGAHNHHGKVGQAHHQHEHEHGRDCYGDVPSLNTNLPVHEAMLEAVVTDGSVYNVFPFGIEAPIFGDRELLSEPADLTASPFGWHDTNGQPGPEHTITRGNNVRAYPDRDADNSEDSEVIDGGEELIFDFYYEDNQSPDTILSAAVTQLFYMNNMIHDFTYHHGFDEASGNFQQNNYGNGGAAGDPVRAEAQDGGGTNNANFATPADGGSGRMQMFLWNNTGASFITIDEPGSIAATLDVGSALFGPTSLDTAITAEVAVAIDGTASPELVCEDVVNGNDIKDRIALIRRGDCFFEQKVLNAEAAQAVAVIICNPENTLLNMAGGVDNDEPTIPSVLIQESRCAEIRAAIAAGDTVIVTFPATEVLQPIDGDFDNGIVAHEYGHGISNRTVGGPNNTSCLFNGEQMGEGWSDFFALVTSPLNGSIVQPNGTEPRGIGNFALARGVNGGGIRRVPYSTDFNVNSQVYDDVITSGVPHPLGEIWAATLWDLYWAMVEDYGFDSNLVTGTGGNNIAVNLVIEGMKNTSCLPGMVDGRDGILVADELLYDGANQCRIWEVFARRGLGYLADQGSSDTGTDGVQNFEILPSCFETVKVQKRASEDLITAGQDVTFTITVTNDKLVDATNVVVTDEVPEGMVVDPASINGVDDFVIGAGTITFNIGTLGSDDQDVFSYTVTTDPDFFSTSSFFDGAEVDDENWEIFPLNGEGSFIWEQAENDPFEGDFAWFVENSVEANDQVLQTFEPLQLVGDNPTVRFYTQYDTEAGWDGGIVEMSTDNVNWTNVGNDRFLRGGYRGLVQPSAFDNTVTDFNAYWGNSDGYFDAYIDFSDLAGQEIYVRWRFGSDAAEAGIGWWVDNIELLDVFRYNPVTTLTSDEGDMAEARLDDGGVIVEVGDPDTDVVDPTLGLTNVRVFPNPAEDFVKVNINSQLSGQVSVQMLSVDGRMVANRTLELISGGQTVEFATDQLPAGIYLIQVLGADRIHTEKVTIQ